LLLLPAGGFLNLSYDGEAQYPSELAQDGAVRWHVTEMDSEGWIHVLYPDIDWKFNQQSLGWAFNQFQAWARSSFTVPPLSGMNHQGSSTKGNGNNNEGLCSVTIQCENVGDFFVDNERLSGDWYGYGLTRHTLRLRPGSRHVLSVRVVHEVRIFGGQVLPPPSKFRCELRVPFTSGYHSRGREGTENQESDARAMVQVVKEATGGTIVMDAVDDNLAGEYISVALRNVGIEKVHVRSVRVKQGSEQFTASMISPTPVALYPSTHRPIALRFEKIGDQIRQFDFSLEFELATIWSGDTRQMSTSILETNIISIEHRNWGQGAYKYTFLDFDGTVQYAAAIPPSDPSLQSTDPAPAVVALHGAGMDQPCCHGYRYVSKT